MLDNPQAHIVVSNLRRDSRKLLLGILHALVESRCFRARRLQFVVDPVGLGSLVCDAVRMSRQGRKHRNENRADHGKQSGGPEARVVAVESHLAASSSSHSRGDYQPDTTTVELTRV